MITFSLLVANKIALVIILSWYMGRMRSATVDAGESPYAALNDDVMGESKLGNNNSNLQGEFI